MHLNKGKYGNDLKLSFFSLKNHREMWMIHTVLPTPTNPRHNSHFNGYGLRWFLISPLIDIKETLGIYPFSLGFQIRKFLLLFLVFR